VCSSDLTLLFAVIFLLCLLLSLGNNTPLHSVFYAIIPVFRFPEKFMLLANLSLLVLAAQGLDRLLTLLKTKRATSLCLLVTLLLIVDLYRAHNHLNPFQDFSFYRSYHPHLEPIMKVAVETPNEFQGNVFASLNQRRGIIMANTEDGTFSRVEAEVPLSEMFGYSTVLRSLTQGKAEFSMEFEKYAKVPTSISEQLRKDYLEKRKKDQK